MVPTPLIGVGTFVLDRGWERAGSLASGRAEGGTLKDADGQDILSRQGLLSARDSVQEPGYSPLGNSINGLLNSSELGEEGPGDRGPIKADDLELLGDFKALGAGMVQDHRGLEVVGGKNPVYPGMGGEEVLDEAALALKGGIKAQLQNQGFQALAVQGCPVALLAEIVL